MINKQLLAELHDSIEGDTLSVAFDTVLGWTIRDQAFSPTAAYAVTKETAMEMIRRMELNVASRSGIQPIPTVTIFDSRKCKLAPENSIGVESTVPRFAADMANEALEKLGLPRYKWRVLCQAQGLPASNNSLLKFVRIYLS